MFLCRNQLVQCVWTQCCVSNRQTSALPLYFYIGQSGITCSSRVVNAKQALTCVGFSSRELLLQVVD